MIYFEIPGVGKLILQMLPLISCHVRANSWKYFANYNDKNLVLFVGKKDIPFAHSHNRNLQSGFRDGIFLSSSIDLTNTEKHVIYCL